MIRFGKTNYFCGEVLGRVVKVVMNGGGMCVEIGVVSVEEKSEDCVVGVEKIEMLFL